MQILGIDVLSFLVVAPAIAAVIILLVPGNNAGGSLHSAGAGVSHRRDLRTGIPDL